MALHPSSAFIWQIINEHQLYARQCCMMGIQWETKPGKASAFMECRDRNKMGQT